MPLHIALNCDGWVVKGFVGEDWVWRDAHKPGTRDVRWWLKARVPGSIHHDLWQAGEIANPYVDRNSLSCEWVSQRTWLYRKTFAVGSELAGSRATLRFDGVDYAARFYLNGECIGRHESQFVPAIFDVSERLLYGQPNLLAVVLDPAPPEQPQVGYTSAVRTRKTRMNYWWDFCPRLVHLGLWRHVSLEITGPARIADVWVRAELSDAKARARVTVTTRVDSADDLRVGVSVAIREAGEVVGERQAEKLLSAGTTEITSALDIEQPVLWWPNGHGEQPLYEAEVRVGESDRRTVSFGIRSLKLTGNANAVQAAQPYSFTVNGKAIFANGWNWVPLDVLYGVPQPDKLRRLLELARRAGVNLLRVWGGGLIESREFYDLCDRYGIMVWQEFIQSSSGIENRPPEDPDVIAAMVTEAEGAAPLLRNHPSLALWCGGNELQRGPDRPCDGTEAMLASLRDVVQRLDAGRAWLPTSPTGPVFGNSLEHIDRDPHALHDVHGPWQHQGLEKQFTLANRTTALLHSEFGAEGAANLRTIEAVLPESHRWPATRDNPSWFHSAAWWLRDGFLEEALGRYPEDLPSFVKITQYLQASAMQYAVEAARRRWPSCSGVLPWQFDEPFPNVFGTAAVDYFAEPKPLYYAIKRAYAPVTVTAKFARQAWGGYDGFEAEIWTEGADEWMVSADVVGFDGGRWILEQENAKTDENAKFEENEMHRWPSVPSISRGRLSPTSRFGFSFAFPFPFLDTTSHRNPLFILSLRLAGAEGITRATNRYLFTRDTNLAALLSLPSTRLSARVDREGDTWNVTVRNDGDWAALGVWLEDARPRSWDNKGWAYFDDNYVHLLPGEEVKLRVEWHGVAEEFRGIEVSAMNVESFVVGREDPPGGNRS